MHQRGLNIAVFLIFVMQAICLSADEPAGQKESDLFLQLREERKMRESADLRIGELEAASHRTERQFDSLRAAFAELYLENQALENEARLLRTQAGQLTLNERPAGATEATELDQRLQDVLRLRANAERNLRELQVQLQTLLDLEDADDALKSLVAAKLESVRDDLNRMADAGNPAVNHDVETARQAAVLAVYPDLQLLILDKGARHGINLGSTWNIDLQNRKRSIQAQVVSLRPRICAAIIRSGSPDDATPGITAKRQLSEPNTQNPNK